ncbi:MAG: hypothetical protein OSA99_12170 [Acidimicrobiales bacterium]|nr:hypothetical protein [Acidimicrobiales bacterium]
MLEVPLPKAAAWAPWSSDRSWLAERDEVAALWIDERAVADGRPVIVQAPSDAAAYRRDRGPVGELARAGRVATYKSPAGHGPTFVDSADIKLLATGMQTANGNVIVATETPMLPLDGWAGAVGAVNLLTGEQEPDRRTVEQVELLDRFVSLLYNGWAHKQVGRRASATYLPKLVEAGMSYSMFVGSMLVADPRHLDSLSDIAEMKRALPEAWREQDRRVVTAARDAFLAG